MPAARAASARLIPSSALAHPTSRLLTRPSRSRRARPRSSAGVRPVAIGTATMAQAPGLLSLPGQLAGRRRRSRLPVAGITLEVVAHVLTPVVVAEPEAGGDALAEGAEALAHRLPDRLQRPQTGGAAGGPGGPPPRR